MISEAIEQLKRSFTDKFVTVLPQQPDLARFAGLTGQIKTVNMSGRALVEFADYHQNIGWYDIDLDHLQVVPAPNVVVAAPVAKAAPPAKAPVAKPAEVKAAPVEKPAPVAKPQAAAPTPAPKAAPKPAAGGARMSVAEMMASARANDGAPAAKAVAKAPVVEEVAKPQAAVGESARTSRANLTAADILAMATSSKRIEKLHAERRPMRIATSAPLRSAAAKRAMSEESTPPMTAAEILALQGKMKVKVQPVVSEPLPKASAAKVVEAKPAVSAPAGAKPASTTQPQAAAKPVAAAPVASNGGRPSIPEILELCRSNAPFGTSLGATAPSTPDPVAPAPVESATPEPVAVTPAAAAPAPASNGSAGGRLSVAEAIAACRASDGG